MKKGNRFAFCLVLAAAVLLAALGCQKKEIASGAGYGAAGDASGAAGPGRRPGMGEQDLGGAAGRGLPGGGAASVPASERMAFENEDIYFAFDSAALSQEAQAILRKKAAFLKAHPNIRVTIEGHCDERGTNEYNLALGEARAKAAKAFLVDLGIPAERLATISYGEERPIVKGSNEEAWAKNRRAHFVIEP